MDSDEFLDCVHRWLNEGGSDLAIDIARVAERHGVRLPAIVITNRPATYPGQLVSLTPAANGAEVFVGVVPSQMILSFFDFHDADASSLRKHVASGRGWPLAIVIDGGFAISRISRPGTRGLCLN